MTNLDTLQATFDSFKPVITKDLSKKIKSGPIRLSASEAAEILERFSYPDQNRHLTGSGAIHCKTFADMMSRGHWREYDPISFAQLRNGEIYMLNGHHRLTGQCMTGRAVLWTFIVYPCRDMDDAKELYATFDTNIRARSYSQILSVVDFAADVGMRKQHASALFQSASMIECAFDMERFRLHRNQIIAERIDFTRSWSPEGRIFEQCTKKAPVPVSSKMWAVGPLAVALVTLRYHEDMAKEFWKAIADNDGLKRGTPEHTFLRSIQGTGRGSAHPLTYMAAIAWNARFLDKGITLIRSTYNGKQKPISILGTPWANPDAEVDNDDVAAE